MHVSELDVARVDSPETLFQASTHPTRPPATRICDSDCVPPPPPRSMPRGPGRGILLLPAASLVTCFHSHVPRRLRGRGQRSWRLSRAGLRCGGRGGGQVGGRMSVKVLALKDSRGKIRLSRRAALADAAAAAAAATTTAPPAA